MIKNLAIAVGGLILLSLIFAFVTPSLSQKSVGGVQCTTEAKICPDGTAVGRTGPQCEFAECPTSKPVTYTCEGGKSISALFSETKADITLSDNRAFTLALSEAASGAKYANEDESVVFWTKDYGAFFEEGTPLVTTYAGCRVDDLVFPEVQ